MDKGLHSFDYILLYLREFVMPISLSSILFENENAPKQETDIKKFDEDSVKKAIEQEFRVSNLQKVDSGDIENSVDTMADVAVGDVVSDDPEDIELDNKSSGTEEKESPDLIDIDSLLNIEPEIEPETLEEAPISIEDEVEELQKKASDPKLAEQLFNKIFGNSQVFTTMTSKKKNFFRVKVTDKIKEALVNKNDKVASENAKQLIKTEEDRILREYFVWKVSKGQDGAGSGTFDTWFIVDTSDTDARIAVVFALGGNKGHKFEKQVGDEFKTKSGPAWQALVEYLSKPENDPAGKGVDLTTDLESFVLTNQNTKVRRPFTGTVGDVGKVVSDLTLKIKNRETPIYVSLKGEGGKTIANNSYTGVKLIEGKGVVPTDFRPSAELRKPRRPKGKGVVPTKVVPTNTISGDSDLKAFATAVGLDNQLVADGLNAWINRSKLERKTTVINSVNGAKALTYVTPQIGFGYIYFREKPNKAGFHILTLRSEKDVREFVGEFISGEIRYPYWMGDGKKTSSRQCTIVLATTKGLFLAEIRNTTAVGDKNRAKAAASLQCNMKVESLNSSKNITEHKTTSQKAQGLLGSLLWPQRLHQ
jgi:predicted regulator of amino acid metabolism with ACT domain